MTDPTAARSAAVLDEVSAETARARVKFGDQFDHTDLEWLAIVTEELGEAAKELNERRIDLGRPDPLDIGYSREERLARLRAEVIQVAATAVRWVTAIDSGYDR